MWTVRETSAKAVDRQKHLPHETYEYFIIIFISLPPEVFILFFLNW
jgi:hypothetical protein